MSSTESPQEVAQIPERDKPFYLAIMSMIALVLTVGLAVYVGYRDPTNYRDLWQQVALVFSPFVMMSWAFYFKDHSG